MDKNYELQIQIKDTPEGLMTRCSVFDLEEGQRRELTVEEILNLNGSSIAVELGLSIMGLLLEAETEQNPQDVLIQEEVPSGVN